MKLVCGPDDLIMPVNADDLRVVLYGRRRNEKQCSAGAAAKDEILRKHLHPAPRAWDLLSIALSVMTADAAVSRNQSPDGWTREINVDIAVADPAFWISQAQLVASALSFLTTDRWTLRFYDGGVLPAPQRDHLRPEGDSVVLLSGGLDSLVGAIDLDAGGRKPFAVSQTVRGDADKQVNFAHRIGSRLNHLQLNHNVDVPGAQEGSQRARSLIFMAFGVVAATSLLAYSEGHRIPLYVCENGFIAINPPLTGARLGSLSTRTAHPVYLSQFQRILDEAELNISVVNPYAAKTKGEMLDECKNQALLKELAVSSTSCGRFLRFNYHHCGRCVPCQVRRAAFVKWATVTDETHYVYEQLGKDNAEHAAFDDVRSVAIAIAAAKAIGIERWLGHALSSPLIDDGEALVAMLQRGLGELEELHKAYGVR